MKATAWRMKDTYFELVREFPLVPLRSEAHYDAALAFLSKLAIRGENAIDKGESAYLEALTRFVSDYEDRHHRIETRGMRPLEALKYLMDQNDMKPIDLGRLLGNRSLATQILHGKRALSKAHISLLSARFRVDPGLFFEKQGRERPVGAHTR
jgi:HTH-type transcriptional regulator/antitoxin HigA